MNALARGASGVRPKIIERFAVFLNEGITPQVPELGSIGASGDLVPLSYAVGALIGSRVGYSVSFRGRLIDARSALRAVGLQPIRLRAKEGLAMINGTSMSTGMAGVALGGARELLAVTLGTHALLVQALDGRIEAFHPFVHEHKPHPGQLWVAARMRSLLNGQRGASPSNAGDAGLVQDRYSVRCLPQFLGPIVEGLLSSCDRVQIELNSASDNPLVDGQTGEFYYGGNFLARRPRWPWIICANISASWPSIWTHRLR
jgi:phenylalanine ammonia-lyase